MQHKEQHSQESCTLWNATLTQSIFVSTCMRMCTHVLMRTHRVLCRRWWIVAGEAVVIEFHFSGSAVTWRAKLERVCSLLRQPRCWPLWFSDALIPTLLCRTVCTRVCRADAFFACSCDLQCCKRGSVFMCVSKSFLAAHVDILYVCTLKCVKKYLCHLNWTHL